MAQVSVVVRSATQWNSMVMIDDSDNTAAKQAIIDEFDWAEEAGYTLDNPSFRCYYLANAKAEVRDSEGKVLAGYEF